MRVAVSLLLLAACSGSTTPAAPNSAPGAPPATVTPQMERTEEQEQAMQVEHTHEDEPVAWRLVVTPSTVAMGARDTVRIRVEVSNQGDAVFNPSASPLSFTVNGQPSMGMDMAFGNGRRGGEWRALPHGATAHDERVGLEIFPAPGDYELGVRVGPAEVARATVHVVADVMPELTGQS